MKKNLELDGFKNGSIAYLEAKGLSKCFEAYAKNCANYEIFEIGFNDVSGYTYIALEDEPIIICSQLGRDVEYLVTNFEYGNEMFFDTYDEAITELKKLN